MRFGIKWWIPPGLIALVLFAAIFLHQTRKSPFRFSNIPAYRTVSRLVLPEFETTERRIRQINKELELLPVPTTLPTGGTFGFLSLEQPASDGNLWIRFEWDTPQMIDALSLVPAQARDQLTTPAPFAFRSHYTVLLKKNGVVIHQFEIQTSFQRLRKTLPHFFEFPAVTADSLELHVIPDDPNVRAFAFGELFIFSGRHNIAPLARKSASSSVEGVMGLSLDYVSDDRTSLGIPQNRETTSLVGYTSGAFHSDQHPVWIELHLSEPRRIDEIRFYPAERQLGTGQNTAGYPQEMDVLVFDNASQTMRNVYQFTNEQGESPGLNPVPMRFPVVETDRIRLEIKRMWKPTARAAATFSLAEIEPRLLGVPIDCSIEPSASATGQEMALTTPKNNQKRYWSVEGLADGMSTEGRILHERDWLAQLSERGDLLQELGQTAPRLTQLTEQVDRLCWRITSGIPLLILLTLVALGLRTRIRHQRIIHNIQDQLAADLHDDLGSNLGSIYMYVQLFQQQSNDQKGYAPLLGLVQDSLDSLKEMIAFTSPRITKPFPLVSVLESITKTHSGGIETTFEVDPRLEKIDYPPEYRRNLRFFLKEALFNAAKHSGANRIDTRILRGAEGTVFLEIRDNGAGLPEKSDARKTALSTLHLRAKEMKAELNVISDEKGLRIRLSLPRPS